MGFVLGGRTTADAERTRHRSRLRRHPRRRCGRGVVPVVGHVGAGLLGGFAAGYLAGGGLGRGAWHGLVAGSLSGAALTLVVALFGGLGVGPLGALFGGVGLLVLGLTLTILSALDSTLAGAVGGWVKDSRRQ